MGIKYAAIFVAFLSVGEVVMSHFQLPSLAMDVVGLAHVGFVHQPVPTNM